MPKRMLNPRPRKRKQKEKDANTIIEFFNESRRQKDWESAFVQGMEIAKSTKFANVNYLLQAARQLSLKFREQGNFARTFEIEKATALGIEKKIGSLESVKQLKEYAGILCFWLEKAIESAEKIGNKKEKTQLEKKLAIAKKWANIE